MTTSTIHKGDVWRMAVGSVERLALVISSNMFNLDSGLGHVLTMLVAPGPGPYSFELTVESEQLHVWPAHLDSTPKHLFIERLGVADPVAISAAHTRLFMILHESNVPPPR